MNPALQKKILKYENDVRKIMTGHKEDIVGWLTKYSLLHSSRQHLFDIMDDIMLLPQCKTILDQGAAEGIICRLIQDEGYKTFAVDNVSFFQEMWNILKVPGAIGDCSTLDWWDQKTHFDVIIATVWVTSAGKKFKKKIKRSDIEQEKISFLNNVNKCWSALLRPEGVVYFDVNERKVPLYIIDEIFGTSFKLSQCKTKTRTLLKAKLK